MIVFSFRTKKLFGVELIKAQKENHDLFLSIERKDDYNSYGTLATQLLFDQQGVSFLFIDSKFLLLYNDFHKNMS